MTFSGIKDEIRKSFAAFFFPLDPVFISCREIGKCYDTGQTVFIVVLQYGNLTVVNVVQVCHNDVRPLIQCGIEYLIGIPDELCNSAEVIVFQCFLELQH